MQQAKYKHLTLAQSLDKVIDLSNLSLKDWKQNEACLVKIVEISVINHLHSLDMLRAHFPL